MNKSMIKTNFKIQIKKHRLGIFAIVSLSIILIACLLAFLSPYDVNDINIARKLQGPSMAHIFGTDELGRDYFTRALYGGRISIMVGVLAMLISTTIGTLVGAISGYMGGRVDSIIMRIIDMLMCIPVFFLILIANAFLKPSIQNIIIIIGIFGWMGIARIVRGETLSFKQREYVMAAKALGGSNFDIIKKHIIPNVIPTVIVAASIEVASAILIESSLSFLGLGVQQPMASLGSMLQAAQARMADKAYLAIFPGLIILILVLSFNVLGDILREALEPRVNED